MSDDILSQEEVDALLKGVSGESDAAEDVHAGEAVGVQSYNLASQDRIVRGRMPTMEVINERFARNLRIGLFNFTRRTAEISVGPVKLLKYAEFVRNLVVPTNLNLMHVKPLRGTALMIFDPNLVFMVIDNLFGGDGRYHTRVEGRDFTQTEQRIIRNLLGVATDELEKAWAPVHPIKFDYIRSEMNTQFANIATPSEVVVVTTFNIEIGPVGGDFHVCMPYAMIEPIRDQLYEDMHGDRMEVDERWVNFLSSQVQSTEVKLVANLTEAELTVRELLEMKIGDVISLDIPDSITAHVEGVPVLECGYGVHNGQYALKVKKFLAAESLAG
ncbi:MAG: flagellar motor switch protein FliM [Methylophilaceae bacterium]|jgi:flagellar motor switch protein FliM|uniref:flagellar motor switch protein FliM n=1 Tax=Methylobacillus sp. MM3 TaxID=1848039 RepID=UPI0007DF43BC|nr:flagellar motor switch protein FliM [Methylobacillus sp. MM3]OAJ71993.1 flagellar motor switch protein FliM [Methylobacillus sp. MM3]